MQKETQTTSIAVREMPFIGLFAALTAVFSYIEVPLPFSPVPITAQTLAVMLAGSILTPGAALLSMVVFLLLGIIGLPVYAGGASGIGTFFGPTGGFLMSWPIAAFIMAHIMRRIKPGFMSILLVNILGGIIIIYAIGVLYLARVAHLTLPAALVAGALPFIPGDVIKALLSTTIALSIRKAFKNNFPMY
ncbi:MAG: biotin transport system substrate-specific component [Thermoanaerobacteraceae bacterium]|jgi:biotin transport system substrate-specific component|uniref:Biotin transporter n=1 Tax=Biomaibacter acetigenes TaxID=2316383 RepID=A0A3G2R867_9FIRM|nr:biotin transporter BioY [Biomaibacter acetigenes]MDK2879986.1 biotin transport system substrate-specific component [Thermoanaerobacteraceae bacterium]RKL63937.1 biotin transporter BioY [Thermoanaerobacteraceae bacterium SP2]AYO30987.1 biotin transporter BioY [Biomaibacter acetigenes]MDN5302462.1 biotin transport system substrate-specific component [Thermoanaerobacteraceae bacterium]MDN5311036.1 biotin transport system substrate-specific component [Thermoanaerobacteraceae bacterium]